MKKLCIAVLLFCTAVADDQKPQNASLNEMIRSDANYYVQEYVAQLPTSVDVDRLGNLLYYNYLTSTTESTIRVHLFHLRKQSSSLDLYDAEQDEKTFDVLAMMAARTERIKRLLPTHDWAIKRWRDCLITIEKEGSSQLKRAVDALQTYGQLLLQECIAQQSPQFGTILHRETALLQELQNYLSSVQLSFKTLSLPEQKNETDALRAVRNLSDAFLLSNNLLMNLATVHDTTTSIKNISIDLINLNSVIFFEFYQAMFQKYQPIYCIFDQEGNLCCDSQQMLPNLMTLNEELQ